jgi:hypothetical protein
MSRRSSQARLQIHNRMATDLTRNAMVAPAIVDDPLGTILGEKIQVTRSLRDDTLAWMRAREFIEEHQYQAGRLWEKFYHFTQIGGVRAIDPTKEAVDGGRLPEPITDAQMQASDRLLEADTKLGMEGSVLIRDILGYGLTLRLAGARRGMSSEAEIKYMGKRFRECLDTVSKLWGFRTST